MALPCADARAAHSPHPLLQLLTGKLPFSGEEGSEVSQLYMSKQASQGLMREHVGGQRGAAVLAASACGLQDDQERAGMHRNCA